MMFGFHFLLIRLSGKTDVLFEDTKTKALCYPAQLLLNSINKNIEDHYKKNQGLQTGPNRQHCGNIARQNHNSNPGEKST